jgi:hypothetical protein
MAIGLGECREKVRSMMIEVCFMPVICIIRWNMRTVSNNWAENDTTGWKASGGSGLIV